MAISVGERIKELREKAGYSQKDIADIMHLRQSAVSAWEIGRNEPNIQALIKLAEIFKVSVDYLIGSPTLASTTKDEELAKKIQALSERDKVVIEKVLTALADEKEKSFPSSAEK